jgi:hypothetical protein
MSEDDRPVLGDTWVDRYGQEWTVVAAMVIIQNIRSPSRTIVTLLGPQPRAVWSETLCAKRGWRRKEP